MGGSIMCIIELRTLLAAFNSVPPRPSGWIDPVPQEFLLKDPVEMNPAIPTCITKEMWKQKKLDRKWLNRLKRAAEEKKQVGIVNITVINDQQQARPDLQNSEVKSELFPERPEGWIDPIPGGCGVNVSAESNTHIDTLVTKTMGPANLKRCLKRIGEKSAEEKRQKTDFVEAALNAQPEPWFKPENVERKSGNLEGKSENVEGTSENIEVKSENQGAPDPLSGEFRARVDAESDSQGAIRLIRTEYNRMMKLRRIQNKKKGKEGLKKAGHVAASLDGQPKIPGLCLNLPDIKLEEKEASENRRFQKALQMVLQSQQK
jgi:hypothetical protein